MPFLMAWTSTNLNSYLLVLFPKKPIKVLALLDVLTSMLKNMRMSEDEVLFDFLPKLFNLVNESFTLGEQILENKLVQKVLKSLPNRFVAKTIVV